MDGGCAPKPSRKQRLRADIRARRRGLAARSQRRHALAVADAVAARLAHTDVVAAYLARDGEVDLAPLIDTLWRQGTVLALPVLGDGGMFFAAYGSDERLHDNRYGIPEPAQPRRVDPTVVLTPLVAFDARGQRLGMGGGYYDRYFQAAPTVRRIGIAHECQRVAALPVERGDMPLEAVATERGWYSFAATV